MVKNLFDFGSENIEDNNSSNKTQNQYGYGNQNAQNQNTYNNFQNPNENYSNLQNQNNNSNFTNVGNNFNNSSNKTIYANEIEGEAKNLYDKYKDYSQNDLINEFLSTSKQKLKDGSLTQEKISSTANALLPYLNDSQREMMSRLLERLND